MSFQSIQQMILQLEQLDTLDLSNNLITDLPENIGDLHNLTVLRINNNSFIKVPESIGKYASPIIKNSGVMNMILFTTILLIKYWF